MTTSETIGGMLTNKTSIEANVLLLLCDFQVPDLVGLQEE
jgi:hypothetical protein